MKMQHATAAALLLALGFAGSAGAATALRDFGPIAVTGDETVRLVVKYQDVRPFGQLPPAANITCALRVVLSAGPGYAAPPTPFSLAPGAVRVLDIDPARMGPPIPSTSPTNNSAYVANAMLSFDVPQGTSPITAAFCEQAVNATVVVIDKATGAIRRADDTFTETH